MPQAAGPSLQHADFNGTVELNGMGEATPSPIRSISDGTIGIYRTTANSSTAVSNSFQVFAVNDAPTNLITESPHPTVGSSRVAGGQNEDNSVEITAAQLLAGLLPMSTIDDNSLTIAGISANNGTLSDDGEGNYSFSPDADFNGEVTLNYVIADPDGGRTLASTTFTIASVNDGPEFNGSEPITLANIQEDSELVFTEAQLLNGFADRDGDTLSVTGLTVNTADAGTIDGDAANGYTFTANANYNGPVELTYIVTDGTESTSATASFNVFSVNDAPVINDSVAQVPFEFFEGNYYTVVSGPTWDDAQAQAFELGGNLVSIGSEQESQFLIDSFKDVNLGHVDLLPFDQDVYWIGLTKESGQWQWSDGTDLTYQQWGPLEPYEDNGFDDRAEVVLDFGEAWAATPGNWNNSTADINLRFGIAEIASEAALFDSIVS